MRVAILTQPLRYNIGGLLQNYAMQLVLKRMGHKPVTLDPDPYRHVSFIILIKRLILKLSGNKTKIFIEKEYNKVPHTKGQNTDRFIKKYINCIRYNNLTQLKLSRFDAFIVGSDQVWRPKYNYGRLGNMFLDFTKGLNVKRIAYAASFGTDDCEFSEEERKTYGILLQSFDSVSVREKTSVLTCKERFGVEAVHVLDPTLLLRKTDYINIIKREKEPISQGNILVYFLDVTEDKKLLTEKVVNDYSLMPFYVNNQIYKHEIVPQIPVSKWLRGFYDAQFVITDSFHACVFSIIFNKPFILYANMDRGFSRYQSLFESFNLNNCMVLNSGDYKGMPSFDFETINNLLGILQKKSIKFLEDVLCDYSK